jgi:FkbM family methyltransferase
MPHITINTHTIHYASRPSFWQSVERGDWEPETFKVLDMYLKPGSGFLDIGAWNGVCSLYAHAIGAKCYAVEADRKAYDEMLENVAEQQLFPRDIYMHNIAISDAPGQTVLTSMNGDFGNSESSLIERPATPGQTAGMRVVKCDTLAGYIKDANIKPTLIKVDVEGSEVLIFRDPATLQWLTKHHPVIYISFHPAWFPNGMKDARDLWDSLTPIYRFHGKRGLYTCDMFMEAMGSAHEHSFILKEE